MHSLLQQTSLKKQFERRQKDFKPNMHVQDDVPLFRVDPVIAGQYVAPNAENEITMECFDLLAWQEVVHDNESDCGTP